MFENRKLSRLLNIPPKIKVCSQYQDFWFEYSREGLRKAKSQCEWQHYGRPEIVFVDFELPENFLRLLEIEAKVLTFFSYNYVGYSKFGNWFVSDGGNGTGLIRKNIPACLIQHLLWFFEKPKYRCFYKKQILRKQEKFRELAIKEDFTYD